MGICEYLAEQLKIPDKYVPSALSLICYCNFILVIAAVMFIVFGVKSALDAKDQAILYKTLVTTDFSLLQTFSVIMGVILFVIPFFGCCAELKRSSYLLTVYAVVVGIIFFVQFVVGIYGLANFKPHLDASKQVEAAFDRYVEVYKGKINTPGMSFHQFDNLQCGLKCCGCKGAVDALKALGSDKAPASCCCRKLQEEICEAENAYKEGCSEKLGVMSGPSRCLGVFLVVIAVIEFAAAVLNCLLAFTYRKK